MALDATGIRALSFDCYGTLIDWDLGLRNAIAALESLRGCDLDRLLREREEAEKELLAGSYRSYGAILADSLRAAAGAQDRKPLAGEIAHFVDSMGKWPSFPDTGAALRRLGFQFALALLSNVENKTLASTARILGAPFAVKVTAEDLKSYKPAPLHWEKGLEKLHQPKEAVLHVAGSLYHDIRPARELGFRTVWINRRDEPIPDDLADQVVYPDLASLVNDLLGPETLEPWEI
jgi:2-haloacid dehalogenase